MLRRKRKLKGSTRSDVRSRSSVPKCPICITNKSEFIYIKNGFDMFRCTNCNHVFVYPIPKEEELQDFYKNYYEKNLGNNYAKTYGTDYPPAFYEAVKVAEDIFPKTASILDVGCATGLLLRFFKEKGFNQVVGCDVSDEVLKRKVSSDLDIRIGRIEDMVFEDSQFDYITAIYVLEHLLIPYSFLNSVKHLLKPGGYVFVETPYIYGLSARIRRSQWTNMKPPQHLNFFSKKSLKLFFSKKGDFEILNVNTPYPIPKYMLFGKIIGRIGLGGHIRLVAKCVKLPYA